MIEVEIAKAMAGCRNVVGVSIAEGVFGYRVYTDQIDRQLATGAAAVDEVAIEEALLGAALAEALRLAVQPAPLEPGVRPTRLKAQDACCPGRLSLNGHILP